MVLVDTHVHLEDSAYQQDQAAVIQRAKAAGIVWLLNAGSTAEANPLVLKLAQQYPEIYAGIGLHPHEFAAVNDSVWAGLPDQLSQEKVVALGEIGLDYHIFPNFPEPNRTAQQAAFRKQLKMARLFELPIIVHVREAFADALQLLQAEGPWKNGGVMHCYAGGPEQLAATLALGLHIGVGATVTYPKAESIRQAVAQVPLARLLLETDAPYLPPQLKRGQRNEPAWISEVAAKVAEVRGISQEELGEATSHNATSLFKAADRDPGTMVYDIRGHLYVNLTNRCSADCVFCPRRVSRQLHAFELTLAREPRAKEVIRAIGDPKKYQEIVFCGFGEPVLRWPVLLEVARHIKAHGGRVRVNTNGQADGIFGRDILPEGRGVVDTWSVSLNSMAPLQYVSMVRPTGGQAAHHQMLDFIRRAAATGYEVFVTAVELPDINAQAIRQYAKNCGAIYRGRQPQRLGDPE